MNTTYVFFRFYLIPPTPFNKNKVKMAVQEMHTIQKVEGGGGVDGNAEGRNAHAQKKQSRGEEMGRRAMCRVQPLYIKNREKNGEKSYNT